jgi:two-component system sensor histidine kinase VicK
VAEQVGPVLQMFAQRIGRERTISVIKHDLTTPLGMITDLIQDVSEAHAGNMPIGEHDLDNIQACAFLALNLAKQLDPMPGKIERLNREPTLLEAGIVARLCRVLRRYARLTNEVEIQYDGFRAIPWLLIDREQIERAILNLLLNAIKYSDKGGMVNLIGRRTGSGFCVDVSDQGMGVQAEDASRIFEPGVRSAEAAQRAQGLGLGLTIARQIMKAHNGDVALTSLRSPTTFTLTFPADAAYEGQES